MGAQAAAAHMAMQLTVEQRQAAEQAKKELIAAGEMKGANTSVLLHLRRQLPCKVVCFIVFCQGERFPSL